MKFDMTNWTDKASKDPGERRLYEEADDYVAAYAAHTDLRIIRDGPHLAIGGQWEEHGPLQLNFLIQYGLTNKSKLLDFGCGTGRFARHAVPYLDSGNYIGVDISPGAINHAKFLASHEGWGIKNPILLNGDGTLSVVKHKDIVFDIIWAHSVFTHLPEDCITAILDDMKDMKFRAFYFTYKYAECPRRSGLKQFQYPPAFFAEIAQNYGMRAEALTERWPAGQRTMRIYP